MKMPASNIDSYLQDARNNFDAVRPAPVCDDSSQALSISQCQNVHVSTNCYYGYHDLKSSSGNNVDVDCEMVEVAAEPTKVKNSLVKNVSKKRCADEQDYPQTKRLRDDDSSMCSLVGTRSSPSHSASAFNVNISNVYTMLLTYKFLFKVLVMC